MTVRLSVDLMEERRQQRRASALHDVAAALNETDALADLLPLLAERTAEAVSADRVGIHVYDESGGQVLLAYRHGDTAEEFGRAHHLHEKSPHEVPAERRMLETGDVVTDPAALNANNSPTDVVALAPLSAHGEILGALYVRRRDGRAAFDARDLSLLKAIGGQGGIAVERARLAEAAARRAEHLALLNQVGRELAGTLAVDELCAAIHEQVRRVLAADAFFIALHEQGDDHVWFPYMFDEGRLWNVKTHPLNDGPTSRVVRTRQPFVMHPGQSRDHLELISFGNEDRESAAAVYVPMLHHDRLIGVLSVQRYDPNPYGDDELRTLETIAQQAAVSLANARLHAETISRRQAAERHAENLEAVLATSRAIVSAGELPAVLDALAAELAELVPYDEIAVYRRLEPDAATLHPILNRSRGQDLDPSAWTISVGEGLIGGVFLTRQAELINDAQLDPRSVYPHRQDRYQSHQEHVVQAPLIVADEVIGVLHVSRVGGTPFTDDEFTIFRVIAGQAAVAIQSASLLAEARAAQRRTERHAANLEAVLTTTRAITSQIELADTLGALADHLERLIPHEQLGVWLADDATGKFRPFLGRRRGHRFTPDWEVPLDRSIMGRVLREGMAAMVNDAHLASDAYFPPAYPTSAPPEHMLIGPLVAAGRTIGVLVLHRPRDSRFTAEDFAVFEVLAAQAGVAVQASLLLDEERRRRRQATALVEVAGALNRANTLDEVVQYLTEAVIKAVGAESCSVYVYDETAEQTIASAWVGSPDPSMPPAMAAAPPSAFPVEHELIATGAAVVGERLWALMEKQRVVAQVVPRASAALPLRRHGRFLGAMYVWSSVEQDLNLPPRDFDAYEIALLEAIAEQAAVAIERARLHADTERRIGELRVLGGVSEAIARSLDLGTVIGEALHHVRTVIPHDDGHVALWDDRGATLRVAETWGEYAERRRGLSLPLNDGVDGVVFQTGEPRVGAIDDAHPFLTLPDNSRPGRLYLCVPLQIEQRAIGTLCIQRREEPPFTPEDLELCRLIAGQLAVGIQRIQIYEMAVAARERSERQAQSLETVLANSQLLALQSDLDSTLAAFSEGIFRLVRYSACAVFRAVQDTNELHRIHDRVIDGPSIRVARFLLGEGITGEAALRREAVCVANAERDERIRFIDDTSEDNALYCERGLHVMAVPLLVEGALIGAVTIGRVGGSPFSDEEFAAVRVYAGQAAAAIRNAELLVRNRDLYLGGVRALASAVDAKDAYTRGHSGRVSRQARQIAEAMGLSRVEAERVELAGLLHDIGKIGIPDAILQKPSQLDDAERAVMMGHTALGVEILTEAGADALKPLVPLVCHHHEWHNGGGYPGGLAGDEIPLGAAIIAVADAFDTIVTDRPYRGRRAAAEAIAELRGAAGSQFRPDVVDVLAQLVDANDLPDGHDAIALARLSTGDRPADHRHEDEPQPAPFGAGQMGDLRALGLLVELAGITRHIPDLREFLNRVASMVRRRLGYEDVMLMLVDEERRELVVAAHAGEDAQVTTDYRQSVDVGICGEVVRTGRARNVRDTRTEPGFFATWPDPHGSELVVPLIVDDKTIGVINVESSRFAAFTAADEAVLTAVAGQVATAVHVAQLHDAVKQAAGTDGLTGLANHRAFYEALERETRVSDQLCIMVLDVEGLKQVNDSAGHLAGDALLRLVAETIRSNVRATDVVARYGGDEFGVIMRAITIEDAITVGQRIRRTVLDVTTRQTGLPHATVRYGVALFPDDGAGPYDLVAVADSRLYEMRARTAGAWSPPVVAGD